MKKYLAWIGLLLILVCLMACQGKEVALSSMTSTKKDTNPNENLTATRVLSPTLIPTQTATFYSSTPILHSEPAATDMSAKSDTCPEASPEDFQSIQLQYQPGSEVFWVRHAISSGASFDQILSFLYVEPALKSSFYTIDLTADDVPELVVDNPDGGREIYQCRNGMVEKILNFNTTTWPAALDIQGYDLNHNGIPEIIVFFPMTESEYFVFDILEWNGSSIASIMQGIAGTHIANTVRSSDVLTWYRISVFWNGEDLPVTINADATFKIADLNQDGFEEIILKDHGPKRFDGKDNIGPWLGQELILQWNGEAFVFSEHHIDEPVHRFQALQEADRAFLNYDYDRAADLYSEVIHNENLLPWSEDFLPYLEEHYDMEGVRAGSIGSFVLPESAQIESQQLSAYAYYRLMLIQIAVGNRQDALVYYTLLEENYPEESAGYPYAEMGRIYWQTVRNGTGLVEACQSVKDYVIENPQLLHVLGDEQHGGQSHSYNVYEVCPLDETDVKLLSGVE